MGRSIQDIIQDLNDVEKAEIRRNSDLRPRRSLRLAIALDTAATAQNPFLIANPFNGFYVDGATDAVSQANLSLGAADQYATDNSIPLRINASGNFNQVIRGAYLTWTAQPGKIITIDFFLGVEYRPGSFVNSFTGAVNILSGSSVATGTLHGSVANLSVTTAVTQLCDQNLARAEFNFFTAGDIWIGDNAVAVNRGVFIPANSKFDWQNTGTLYAITAAGTALVTGMEQRQ